MFIQALGFLQYALYGVSLEMSLSVSLPRLGAGTLRTRLHDESGEQRGRADMGLKQTQASRHQLVLPRCGLATQVRTEWYDSIIPKLL